MVRRMRFERLAVEITAGATNYMYQCRLGGWKTKNADNESFFLRLQK